MTALAPAPAPVATGRASKRTPIVRLAWMLARPGAVSPATVALPLVAFAVTTALVLIVMGGALMFWRWTDENAELFQILSILALGLLIVPFAALGGAAARLSARRRDDRLATLRLLGATTSTVTLMTMVESVILAVVGAVGGVVLYAISMPLIGLIPFRGAPIGPMAIGVDPMLILAVIAGVSVLAAVSSVIGLRSVTVSPLGVRLRQKAPHTSRRRLTVGALIVVIAIIAMNVIVHIPDLGVVVGVVVTAFATVLGVLALVGPFAMSAFGRVQLRMARSAERLIAARSILESPKAAWRMVGGVAMTSFLAVIAGAGTAMLESVEDAPGIGRWLAADVRTGILITLVASFMMVACSVGVGQAAAILDRRDLYVSLDRIGMPVATMNRSRVRAVMTPLVFVAVCSAGLGALLVLPLLGSAAVLAPLSLAVVAICFVAGLVLVRLSLVATRSVLGNVLAHPERSLG